MSTSARDWADANQTALADALSRVRECVESWLARRSDADATATPLPPSPELSTGDTPPALHTLCLAFRLSAFERDVLLLCGGVDLDARVAELIASANGDAGRTSPTFALALAALPGAHWSALSPGGPLRHWHLIEVGTGESLTTSALRIDERVLHYLAGVASPDDRVHALLHAVPDTDVLGESQRRTAVQVAQLVAARAGTPPLVQLCGEAGSDQRAVAAAAAALLGLRLRGLHARDVPLAVPDRGVLARLLERESVLSRMALFVDVADADAADRDRAVALLDSMECPAFIAVRDALDGLTREVLRVDVAPPPVREQRELWRSAVGPLASSLNGALDAVTRQFQFSAREISNAATRLRVAVAEENTADGENEHDIADRLWTACRVQARARLEPLARRMEPSAQWDALVLPSSATSTLREIVAHVRQRCHVYEHWGFAARGSRGLGITALFIGASGTGKTMAAEVLANELKLDLFRIDLSAVVSKYIGETEKNLRRVFDAAEAGAAILLFDEADALFGKRSEVKDSHDRYANIEVGYLLQRMEAYRGLAILTSNMKNALDHAFLRRLRFVVQFPFPDRPEREAMWHRAFPAATPTDGLVLEQLANLNVSGGNIRNIALNAAFLAADAAEPVRMKHVLHAARCEYAKLDRPLNDAELGVSP